MSFDINQLNGRKIYDREAGILMPVFSLPGKYGIGDLGHEAKQFVDILKQSNQQLWAILPNGPVSFGNSPYQGVSAFAGNPYYISPDLLVEEGLLTRKAAQEGCNCLSDDYVDYGILFQNRPKLLKEGYKKFIAEGGHRSQDFLKFKFQNHSWLEDYALFMHLKEKYHQKPWTLWPEGLKNHDKDELNRVKKEDNKSVVFWEFVQYEFFKQWDNLKKYANDNGVKLIGDMPFYVGHDSCDVWANREIFELNSDGSINLYSGLPGPDNTNIIWGNPCYNWEKMKATNYDWLAQRIQKNAQMYDIMRIDHAIAFVHYFGIKDKYIQGSWYNGPDMFHRSATDVIDAVSRQKNMDIIVENLGNNIQRTHDLYDQLNWIGMRIFDYTVGDMHYGTKNIHLPSLYPQNVAAYTGTHDNETLSGIIASKSDKELEYIMSYLRVKSRDEIVWGAIDALYKSSAAKVILPVQDVLCLDNSSRICYLEDYNKSWHWRLKDFNKFDGIVQNKLKGLSVLSARGEITEKDIRTKGWNEILGQAIKDRYMNR